MPQVTWNGGSIRLRRGVVKRFSAKKFLWRGKMLILLPQREDLYRDAVLGGVGMGQLRGGVVFIRTGREGGFFPWEKLIPKIKLVVFPRLEDFLLTAQKRVIARRRRIRRSGDRPARRRQCRPQSPHPRRRGKDPPSRGVAGSFHRAECGQASWCASRSR